MANRSNRTRRRGGAFFVFAAVVVILAVVGVAMALVSISITADVSSNEFVATPTTTTTAPTTTTTTTAAPSNGLVMDLLDVGEGSCGPDFTTGPFAMNAISFDLNATEAQVVHALCAINPGDVDVTDISVELVSTASGESGCSAEEAAVDPGGAGCGSSGELADLLGFTFTVGNNPDGTCSSATLSTSSPVASLGSMAANAGLCAWVIAVGFDGSPSDAQKLAASTDTVGFSLNLSVSP